MKAKAIAITSLKTLLTIIISCIVGTILMILAYLIPTSALFNNVKSSSDILSSEGTYYRLFYSQEMNQLDNWTDAIMLNIASFNDEDLSVIEKALLNEHNGFSVEGLENAVNGGDVSINIYGRYWNGYNIFLKPLLLIFDINGIRILNFILQAILVGLICLFMWKKCKKLLIPYLLSLISISPFVVSMSMQFSSVYYIFNFVILFILIFYDKLNKNDNFKYVFLISGILTSFFDFLTYPLITLLMPLIMLFYMKNNDLPSIKQKLLYLLKLCVFWAIGYIGMWVSKWVVASIFTDFNMFQDGLLKVFDRIDEDVQGLSSFAVHILAVLKNLYAFIINPYLLIPLVIFTVAFIIYASVKQLKFKINNNWIYILIALIPIAWYLVVGNHSYIHYWFTSRALSASLFAFYVMAVACFENQTVEIKSDETANEEKTNSRKIAVLIPCYNEHLTIEKVIKRYKEALPTAEIYVYDNNSSDNSDVLAKKAGAIVRYEKNQGKGYVVRSMFKGIDADCYFMVDADDTYMADNAQKMCDMVLNGEADMVIGDRLSSTYMTEEKRKSHTMGNKLVRFLINKLFKNNVNDIMTGQRAFSKRFVKTFECKSNGFEIETEMTIFACNNNMTIKEVPVLYKDRPEGSFSKLNTYKDGIKVLKTIFTSFVKTQPLKFFGWTAVSLFVIGFGLFSPVLFSIGWHKTISIAFLIVSLIFGVGAIASCITGLCLNKKLKRV